MYEEAIEALEKQAQELNDIIERLRRMGIASNGNAPAAHKARPTWTPERRRKFLATVRKKQTTKS